MGEYAKRHPVIRQDVKEYKTPEGESSFDVENIKNEKNPYLRDFLVKEEN